MRGGGGGALSISLPQFTLFSCDIDLLIPSILLDH